jgi:hypothetical protein
MSKTPKGNDGSSTDRELGKAALDATIKAVGADSASDAKRTLIRQIPWDNCKITCSRESAVRQKTSTLWACTDRSANIGWPEVESSEHVELYLGGLSDSFGD